jgi:large repetitive protein
MWRVYFAIFIFLVSGSVLGRGADKTATELSNDCFLPLNEYFDPEHPGELFAEGRSVNFVIFGSSSGNFIFKSDFQNEPPVITGQTVLELSEDGFLTITLSNLEVTDPDNAYPADFTLAVYAGTNYSVAGTTITPSNDFSGILTVPVSVSDGTNESALFDLSVTVNPVNDSPVITGQVALQTPENQPLALGLSDLYVNDIDNNYPDGFLLSVSSGSNYSVSGTTITPANGFNGTLTVPVTVYDGSASSDPFNVQIDVTAINDAPVINGQNAVSTSEEQPIAIGLQHLTVSDTDNTYPDDFTISVSTGTNYSVAGSTITPAENYNGVLTVPVTVNDGTATSNTFNLTVDVIPVNDAPVITGQGALTTPEDTPITLTLADLHVSDPDNQYPTGFSLSVSAGANYTVSGATITPSSGYNGVLSVPVSVSDGSASSVSFDAKVQVAFVNTSPVITGQTAVQISEEQAFTITLGHLTVNDPDNTYPTDFTLHVADGTNYTVSGNIITPSPNFSGTLTVPVTVNDGLSDSAPFNFLIDVLSENDAPVITGQTSLSTNEDEAITINLTDLMVTDNDDEYPTGFSLVISAGNNYTVQSNVVTPALNFSGNLTVPVTVNDGSLASAPFNLNITVSPVNDAPVITGQTNLATSEETPLTLTRSNFTVADPDNNYPDGFTLHVEPGSGYAVNGTTITPDANFSGTLSVGVMVNDGMASSAAFSAKVDVGNSNDAPVITGQQTLQTSEEQAFTILLTHLAVSDPDNTYPTGFILKVSPGSNYTVAGNTITPAKDFAGVLTVPVSVNDGLKESNVFDLQVSVNPINDAPVITGQAALSTYKNKALTIALTDLQVTDPDNSYPDGFSLLVGSGQNYTVLETNIIPANNFVGILNIPVTVTDGLATSTVFTLKVNVVAPPNVKPVIIGQVTLTTYQNQPIILKLVHLVVNDPDNRFPDDFTMQIGQGDYYKVNGNEIVPDKNFSGTLKVRVTVRDKELTSDPYVVTIQVLPVTNVPLITSQAFLRINEDDSVVLQFTDLIVADPDDTYPNGFTLAVEPGSNYIVNGLEIIPARDFNGYLSVPVTVNDGSNTSAPYQLLILVEAVNDIPLVADTEPGTSFYSSENGGLKVFEAFTISDVDDDTLSYAQVSIGTFQKGVDTLLFESNPMMRGIFDSSSGNLVIFGNAAVEDYVNFIRNVIYRYSGDINPDVSKTLTLQVNDGKVSSTSVGKTVSFDVGSIVLDIPGGFTPNGDGANDTWNIRPAEGNHDFNDAIIRVYNRRGIIVFEARGLQPEWDGRMNGNFLPADTYFYTIDLQGVYTKNTYKGVVTILR